MALQSESGQDLITEDGKVLLLEWETEAGTQLFGRLSSRPALSGTLSSRPATTGTVRNATEPA